MRNAFRVHYACHKYSGGAHQAELFSGSSRALHVFDL
jgi:hypothetical protein